jgi:hypothetical protein
MTTSALLLLLHGFVLLFAPEMLFRIFYLGGGSNEPVAAQLAGGALISLGLMNWTGRGLVLGGIYGRVLVYGNFAHSLIGFLIGLRARLGGAGNEYFWIEILLYLIYAVLFGVMLFRGPVPQARES